jgi:hypothetical protein
VPEEVGGGLRGWNDRGDKIKRLAVEMGSSFSSIFSTVPNTETKTIINTLLKRLVTEVDMRDMYSLSDPRMCREYIVVATTGLEQLFKAIKINKTKDGILLFQKIKGIQQANPDPVKQLQYCRELAFFYVRIFQIYAAIALSIMDSDLPDADPVVVARESRLDRRGVVFVDPKEGLKGFKQRPASWRLPVFGQRGGEIPVNAPENQYLPDTAAPYNILNRFLIPVADTRSNMRMKRPGSRSEYSLYITQASIYAFDLSGNRTGTTLPTSRPRIVYNSNEADMTIDGTDTIRVILNNFKINGRTVNEERLRNFTISDINDQFLEEIEGMFGDVRGEVAPPTFSAVDFLMSKRLISSRKDTTRIEGSNTVYVMNPTGSLGNSLDIVYQGSYKYDDSTRRIRIYAGLTIDEESGRDGLKQYRLRLILNEIRTEPSDLINNLTLPYASDGDLRGATKLFSDDRIPIDKDGRTIGGFLDRTFKNMLSERDEFVTRNAIYQTREGLPEPLNSDSIPESMRIKSVWKALAKKPAITAHCKARALQLLNLAAIKGVDKDAYSSMCLTKFPYAKDGSLPPAGQPITQEYGIKALAMLFVDMIENGNPKITSTDEYRDFRLKFKEYFERADLSEGERAPADFNEIQEKLMPGICEHHTGDQVFVGDAVSTLRQKARELFRRQETHIRNSMGILFKLFDERSIRRGDFNLSKYVEDEGMQAIDRIAKETREMLVEYYGDCEKTYKEGLFVMYNKHRENPDSVDYRSP